MAGKGFGALQSSFAGILYRGDCSVRKFPLEYYNKLQQPADWFEYWQEDEFWFGHLDPEKPAEPFSGQEPDWLEQDYDFYKAMYEH